MFDRKAYMKAWKKKNKERVAAYHKAYREANKAYFTNYMKEYLPEYYKKHKEEWNLYAKDWIKKNPEARKAAVRKWDRTNQKYRNFIQKTREASKLKATPSWADLEAIKAIYQNCPKGYHVDHIIPLKGKHVTGLHVEYNLQYLPAVENIRKGNRISKVG